jgi:large subunit ribosomal protein L45
MIKVELPDFEDLEKSKSMSPEEIRVRMKEKGIAPGRPWMERPYEISSTGDVFEAYIPPEGDGKASVISKEVFYKLSKLIKKIKIV